MCYHKQLKANISELEKYYDANARDIVYPGNYYENGYDYGEDPILTVERPKELLLCRWGITPPFEKDLGKAKAPASTLNCISEEMFEKPSFKNAAIAGQRCLIPATGFFEWHTGEINPKQKTPYIIKAKDQEIFSIAGLHYTWKHRQSGLEVFGYTVLTTAANSQMSKLHNSKKRQPVIIKREFEKDWLNPNLTRADVLELCKSMPTDFLVYYAISKIISNPKISTKERNTPDIEKPVEYSQEEIEGVKDELAPAKAQKRKSDNGQQSLF